MRKVAPLFHEGLGRDISWEIQAIDDEWSVLSDGAKNVPTFEWRRYEPPSELWNRDYCVGCGEKFMADHPDWAFSEGWASPKLAPAPDFEEKKLPQETGGYLVEQPAHASQWICEDCYMILMGILNGTIKPNFIEQPS
jgi:hypothetical protein